MVKISTAIIVTPILFSEEPNIKNKGKTDVPKLDELLAAGYRIKIVNNFEYKDAVYAHYVLEREN